MLAAISSRTVPMASDTLHAHQPPVPKDLAWIVEKGVRKDPAARYPSADAMLERLSRRAAGEIPVQCHVTLVMRASRELSGFVDRYPVGALALASAAAALFAIVAVAAVVN